MRDCKFNIVFMAAQCGWSETEDKRGLLGHGTQHVGRHMKAVCNGEYSKGAVVKGQYSKLQARRLAHWRTLFQVNKPME